MYINGATEIGSLWISELQRSTMLTWFYMTSCDLRHLLTSYGKFWQISNVQSWMCVKHKQSCQNSRSKGSNIRHPLAKLRHKECHKECHTSRIQRLFHSPLQRGQATRWAFTSGVQIWQSIRRQECSHVTIIRHHLTIQHHDARGDQDLTSMS